MPDLTILIPLYNEARNVRPLYEEVVRVVTRLEKSYEIIYVDDGSSDGTYDEVRALHSQDKNVRLIRHRRNFGKAQALSNGFSAAQGQVIITMDGDLQDDPEEIPRFLEKIAQGYDLVSGWKTNRQDQWSKTLPSKAFNAITRWVSGVKLHDFNCGFKAYRADVVKDVDVYGEMHRYIPVIAAREGFKVGELAVHHRARLHGRSKYGITRLATGVFDLFTIAFVTKYLDRPLHLFGSIGTVLFSLGFIAGLYLTYLWYIDVIIWNRPLLILAVLFMLAGIQFFSTGLFCELLVRLNRHKRGVERVREQW